VVFVMVATDQQTLDMIERLEGAAVVTAC